MVFLAYVLQNDGHKVPQVPAKVLCIAVLTRGLQTTQCKMTLYIRTCIHIYMYMYVYVHNAYIHMYVQLMLEQ